MKNSLILLILLLIFCWSIQLVRAQNNFEILINTPDRIEFITDSEQDTFGNYYFTGYNYQIGSVANCAYISKANSSGEIVREINFCHPDSSYSLTKLNLVNNSLYAFGSKGPTSSYAENIVWSAILDSNLNVTRRKEFLTTNGIVDINVQSYYLENDHYILLLNAIPEQNNQFFDIGFIEINNNLDSINFKIDFKDATQIGYDFMKDPNGNTFKVFCFGYYPDAYPNYSKLVKFDSTFNYISVDTIAWKLVDQFCARTLDDSTYLLAGKKTFGNQGKLDLGIIKSTNQDQLLLTNHFGKVGDTNTYAAVGDCIDFISENNIYVGGTSNLKALQYPWQEENSWIILNIIDSSLQLKSQMFFGGDAFYHLQGLKATNDGGCLMFAERYDENTQYEEYDVYILKVDSLGLMTSTDDNFTIPVQQLSIVPNPANQYVSIHYPDIFGSEDKEIIFYNSLGIPVKIKDATGEASGVSIDISELPAGLYFVVMMANGKKTATGKLVVTD